MDLHESLDSDSFPILERPDGSRTRVGMERFRSSRGVLVKATLERLTIQLQNLPGAELTINRSSIRSIDVIETVSDPVSNGVLIGIGIGLGTVVAIHSAEDITASGFAFALFPAGGGVLGYLFDRANQGAVESRVYETEQPR